MTWGDLLGFLGLLLLVWRLNGRVRELEQRPRRRRR